MENRGLKQLIHDNNKPSMCGWFNQFLVGLETRVDEGQPNSVFYDKDGETLFELYYEKNGSEVYFFVHYDKIWKVFSSKYDFNYDDTQSFIKSVVEDTLKLVPITPFFYVHTPTVRWKTPSN